MKLEDVKRVVLEVGQRLTGKAPPANMTPDSFWSTLTPNEQRLTRAIAEICEQHGVERTKAHAVCANCRGDGEEPGYSGRVACTKCLGQAPDWEALDAKIREENAHGKT